MRHERCSGRGDDDALLNAKTAGRTVVEITCSESASKFSKFTHVIDSFDRYYCTSLSPGLFGLTFATYESGRVYFGTGNKLPVLIIFVTSSMRSISASNDQSDPSSAG